MRIQRPFVIFSAERESLNSFVNDQRTRFMSHVLTKRGIPYQHVQGKYKGHTEQLFLVFTQEGDEYADVIEKLARLYDQESILFVDANGLAYLLMVREGRTIELGKFKEIPEADLGELQAYTKIEDKFYATVPA